MTARIQLHNPTLLSFAYKLKTYDAKHYLVRPSKGIIEPGTTRSVRIRMKGLSDADVANFRKDLQEFLVVSMPAPPGCVTKAEVAALVSCKMHFELPLTFFL